MLLHTIRLVKFKRPSITSFEKSTENWNSHMFLVGIQNGKPLRTIEVSYKVKYTSTMWPSNSNPRVYWREIITYVLTKTCKLVFTEGSFIIGKNWKQPKCPSTPKWINELLHTHNTMKYYSLIRRNKSLTHVTVWVSLRIFILNERNRTQKSIYHIDSISTEF